MEDQSTTCNFNTKLSKEPAFCSYYSKEAEEDLIRKVSEHIPASLNFLKATDGFFKATPLEGRLITLNSMAEFVNKPDLIKIVYVVGNPISHTLSPFIQNNFYRHYNLPYICLPATVEHGHLEEALKDMYLSGSCGCNLTLPFKTKAHNILTTLQKQRPDLNISISRQSQFSSSTNTISFRGNKIFATSTDGEGWLNSWDKFIKQPLFRDIVIFGAGGAAEAVIFSIFQRLKLEYPQISKDTKSETKQSCVSNIYIVNRSLDKAQKIKSSLSNVFNKSLLPYVIHCSTKPPTIKDGMLLIQATNIGMHPNVAESIYSWPTRTSLLKKLVACDLVYRPKQTKFLKEAKSNGCQTLEGTGMLVFQAILAMEYFTNQHISAKEKIADKLIHMVNDLNLNDLNLKD